MLILCTVLSALAAEVWPGVGNDHRRFVELLKVYTPRATIISIPVLAWHLKNNNKAHEAEQISQDYLKFAQTQCLTGSMVDRTEDQVLKMCGSISMKEIRQFSYANLLYKEVRNGYAHEYQVGKKAESWSMFKDPDSLVTYCNRTTDPQRHRNIHFQIDQVGELSMEVAQVIDEVVGEIEQTKPETWWIDGF